MVKGLLSERYREAVYPFEKEFKLLDNMSLPNFMCIGAAKSGTTTLFDILKQHSNIYFPSFKEPHFFDIPSNYSNGITWYEKTYFKKSEGVKIVADFTPSYLYEKEAAQRIFNEIGKEVKFVIILRNPVDRAFSHYLHTKGDRYDRLSFKEALIAENQRLEEANHSGDYLSKLRFSYVNQGLYSQMIEEYLKFFPKENFLIINFEEEFVARRSDVIKKILLFLGVENQKMNTDIMSNRASEARFIWLKDIMRKPFWWKVVLKKMIPSLKIRQIVINRIQRANNISLSRKKLSDSDRKEIYNKFFREDVNRLESLLNRKMNWD
jgi:hypothetical protein